MTPEDRLNELGIILPQIAKPLASYIPALRTVSYVYVSGNLPLRDGVLVYKGRIPSEVSEEEGYDAARVVAINIMAAIKGEVGDLSKVKRVVRLNGFVQSDDDFKMQPKIINGASDLFVEVFGDVGKHTRAVMGVNTLPLDSPVEIDAIVEIR